ncbi:hydrogenase maturation protease [Sinisalibacter aestuarii]|uniref:Hydrogenase 2 maturation protease n=1 Tax=Sinisalibacter aestuarii TaxID=2949426 RepID=A0ABQ5LQQ5_9RHOB|nr:hydrogenase maturation protease [Sinisalibacter aestuarii]GKY87342.1 hydrogenase 2 maturation protease [Sinisalibacter aestuarii]
MSASKQTILVLGLGNILLTDEQVGVRVAEAVARDPAAEALGIRALDGGTMGLTLLVEMEDADAMVVIDAAALNKAPGSVELFEGAEMDHFLRTRGRNPHDIGLDDVLDGLRLRGAVPENRALVGIQPAALGVGEEMTPEVAAAVPRAAGMVIALVTRWRG